MPELFLKISWSVLLPVFLLVGAGAWLGRVLRLDLGSLNRLNLYVFTPALVFTKFLHSSLAFSQVGTIGLFWFFLVVSLWGISSLACSSRLSTPANMNTLSRATNTVPPIIATRPSVCMVVCIRRRVPAGKG